MDKESKARLQEAKRELDDILASLAGRTARRDAAGSACTNIVFVGPITIQRFMAAACNKEEAT